MATCFWIAAASILGAAEGGAARLLARSSAPRWCSGRDLLGDPAAMTLPNFPGGFAPSQSQESDPDLNVLLVLIEEFKETVDANDNVAISGDVVNARTYLS